MTGKRQTKKSKYSQEELIFSGLLGILSTILIIIIFLAIIFSSLNTQEWSCTKPFYGRIYCPQGSYPVQIKNNTAPENSRKHAIIYINGKMYGCFIPKR